MSHLCSLLLLVLLLTIIKAFHVDIELVDENFSISPKFVCMPSSEKLNLPEKHKVLWNGTQFAENELKELSEKLQADVLMPSMSINSSTKHVCYLVVPGSYIKSLSFLKKRILRDDGKASVPMENGICPTGHRIDQDRCIPCFPGSYTSGQSAECFLCPKDFYTSDKAADSCLPCPEGKQTLGKGAKSEEACIYLNGTEHAEIKQGSPWIILYVLISFILLLLWIAIMILLIRYWKQLKEQDVDEEETTQDRKLSRIKKFFLSCFRRSIHVPETIPGDNENIYAEINDDDGTYEIPIQPEDAPLYLDLEAPPLPPRRKDTGRRTDSIYRAPSKTSTEDQYEIPIRRSAVEQTRRSSEERYEVPIRRGSDDTYVDLVDDPEDHIYSEIKSEEETTPTEKNNETKIKSSKSFEPVNFSTISSGKIPSRTASSRIDEGRKYSSQSRRHSMEM